MHIIVRLKQYEHDGLAVVTATDKITDHCIGTVVFGLAVPGDDLIAPCFKGVPFLLQAKIIETAARMVHQHMTGHPPDAEELVVF